MSRKEEPRSLLPDEQPNYAQNRTYRFPDQPPIPFSQLVYPAETDPERLFHQEKPLVTLAPLGQSVCENGLADFSHRRRLRVTWRAGDSSEFRGRDTP